LTNISIGDPTCAIYNEFTAQVDLTDFSGLTYGWAQIETVIISELKEKGYLDEQCKVTKAFFELEGNYENLSLSNEIVMYQKEIYDIIWKKADHVLQDALRWGLDVYGDVGEVTSDQITNLIKQKIELDFGPNYSETIVGVCYSGAGDTYIQAINKKDYAGEYINVESIVFVGTPLKDDRIIINPNVKTVVTINGEKDRFGSWYINMLPTPDTFTHSPFVENIYNFEIKECGHNDYFYDRMGSSDNEAFERASTKFIAKVAALSNDKLHLNEFLNRQYASGAMAVVGNTYKVDVERVIYDE